jgi:hypothetical protein
MAPLLRIGSGIETAIWDMGRISSLGEAGGGGGVVGGLQCVVGKGYAEVEMVRVKGPGEAGR